jgi:hypothetical protein
MSQAWNKTPNIIQEWHWKITDFIDVNIENSSIYKDLVECLITWNKPLQEKLSILDLPKLHPLTDNQKYHILSILFSSHDQKSSEKYFDRAKNIITIEGIKYINQTLNNALEYYQDYLLRGTWSAFIQKWNKKKLHPPQISLKDTNDVLDFIDATTSETNSRANRQIDCSLLKIAICLNEYQDYEQDFSKAEEKFESIKNQYFFPYFYNEKWKEVLQEGDNDYIFITD